MPNYHWSGINTDGEKINGTKYANSYNDLKSLLIEQNIYPLKIKYDLVSNIWPTTKIKKREISHFIQQLSILMNASIPIITALNLISNEEKNPKLKNLALNCKRSILSGNSLSKTLEQYPQHFSELTTGLIHAGEQSGNLEVMLEELTTYLKKTDAAKRKIIRSLFYPIMILFVAIFVMAILLIFVIPQFNLMFKEVGADIPAYTQIIINFSNHLQNLWAIILGFIISITVSLKFTYVHSMKFRYFLEQLILKTPIIKNIYTHTTISRLTKTLGLMLSAAIPIIAAINISANTVSSYKYRKALQKIIILINNGKSLEQAVNEHKLFPAKINQLIALGEETGTLDVMLKKIAIIYESELNNLTDNLNNLLEPTITLALGIFVGGLVIGIYLPLFKLGAAI